MWELINYYLMKIINEYIEITISLQKKLSNTNKNINEQNPSVNHCDFHQQNITSLFPSRFTNKNSSSSNIRRITVENEEKKLLIIIIDRITEKICSSSFSKSISNI